MKKKKNRWNKIFKKILYKCYAQAQRPNPYMHAKRIILFEKKKTAKRKRREREKKQIGMEKKRLKYTRDQKYILDFLVWYHLFAASSLLFSKSPLLPLSSIAFDTIFSFRFAVERHERTNHSNRSSSHIWFHLLLLLLIFGGSDFFLFFRKISPSRKDCLNRGNRIIWKIKENRTKKKLKNNTETNGKDKHLN